MLLPRGDRLALVAHPDGGHVAHAAAAPPDAQEEVLFLLVEEEPGVEAADRVERAPAHEACGARDPRRVGGGVAEPVVAVSGRDRKSTRLNSRHANISYSV